MNTRGTTTFIRVVINSDHVVKEVLLGGKVELYGNEYYIDEFKPRDIVDQYGTRWNLICSNAHQDIMLHMYNSELYKIGYKVSRERHPNSML